MTAHWKYLKLQDENDSLNLELNQLKAKHQGVALDNIKLRTWNRELCNRVKTLELIHAHNERNTLEKLRNEVNLLRNVNYIINSELSKPAPWL